MRSQAGKPLWVPRQCGSRSSAYSTVRGWLPASVPAVSTPPVEKRTVAPSRTGTFAAGLQTLASSAICRPAWPLMT
ncbi:MAG: hypothetical protein QM765_29515 [Myxococcales bacterium]